MAKFVNVEKLNFNKFWIHPPYSTTCSTNSRSTVVCIAELIYAYYDTQIDEYFLYRGHTVFTVCCMFIFFMFCVS